MSIRRVVPDIHSENLEQSRQFYVDFLGFQLDMNLGWIMTFSSPANPTAQISVIKATPGEVPQPHVTIEVANVDEVYAKALQRGLRIVYPLTDEAWGVRRFFVVDPNGLVLNLMSHE